MIGKLKKMKDELGNYFFPVTSSKAVLMKDGRTNLDDKLTDVETKANDWNNFKQNGGSFSSGIGVFSADAGDSVVFSEKQKLSLSAKSLNSTNPDGNIGVVVESFSDGACIRPYDQRVYKELVSLGSEFIPFKEVYLSGFSKSDTGYTKLPNGMIMQWGSVYVTFSNSTTAPPVALTFPISFPTACCNIQAMCVNDTTGAPKIGCSATQSSRVSSNLRCEIPVVSSQTYKIGWMAIGY